MNKGTEVDEAAEFARLLRATLAEQGAPAPATEFWEAFIARLHRRSNNPAAVSAQAPAEGEAPRVPPPGEEAPLAERVAWAAEEVAAIRRGDLFSIIEAAGSGDSDALSQLLGILDSDVKLPGILFKSGLRPEDHYPDLASKIWESLKKWDGRDFRAYAAQIARNFAADERRRARGDRTVSLPEEPIGETPLPGRAGPTRLEDELDVAEAVKLTYEGIRELETAGEIKPLDVVLFLLLRRGHGPSEIKEGLGESPVLPRLADAMKALRGTRRLRAEDALAIRALLDGAGAEGAAVASDHPDGVAALRKAERALGSATAAREGDLLDREAVGVLCRRGVRAKDLEDAQKMSTNAINLRMNRVRLKLWMVLVDRAYRNQSQPVLSGPDAEAVEQAIVQQRCRAGLWCRMYKDRTCSMERSPAEIAERVGLDKSAAAMERLVDDLREAILRPLEGVIPDYNSCLGERRRTGSR